MVICITCIWMLAMQVRQFYASMGQMMGQQLEEVEGNSSKAASQQGAQAARPEAAAAAKPTAAKRAASKPAAVKQKADLTPAAVLSAQRPTEPADIRPLVTRCSIQELD
jgi:hypothetical protein